MSEKPVGRTKHGELTLDQLASIQPGMARLMEEVAHRYSLMYYACKGGIGCRGHVQFLWDSGLGGVLRGG